jgi:CheY-like chemotaxis protein
MTTTVAYVPDLMDRSRISAVATVTFVETPAELATAAAAAHADLVVVDLGRPGVLEVLAGITTPTIGFGRHTEVELLAAARAAGCDRVLARSAFFGHAGELLA